MLIDILTNKRVPFRPISKSNKQLYAYTFFYGGPAQRKISDEKQCSLKDAHKVSVTNKVLIKDYADTQNIKQPQNPQFPTSSSLHINE